MKIPILQLGRLLITSVQEDLTDQAAMDLQDALLHRAQTTDADGVVIDVSGMDVVDSFLARVLNDTAQMVTLLGARVVICGIRPAVAVTLVEMGRGLIGVETALDLEQGVKMLTVEHQAVSPPATGTGEGS